MKIALKRENDKFSAMTLKPGSGLTCLVNCPRTPKLWPIAHEMALKCENENFSAMTLKPVSGPIGLGIALKPQNCVL